MRAGRIRGWALIISLTFSASEDIYKTRDHKFSSLQQDKTKSRI